MHKPKRKGTPRSRAFWVSLILSGALLPIFLLVSLFIQQDLHRQQAIANAMTQDYLLCSATHVYSVPLTELEEETQQVLDDASINYKSVHASMLQDMCTEPTTFRPGTLSLELPVAADEIDDSFALGLRIEELLFALEGTNLERIGRIAIEFETEERSVHWGMDRVDAFDNLGIVEPETLFEAGAPYY